MAIINTLRNKGGRVLVILIVLALAAFIVGDPSTVGLFGGGPDRDIAEIDGEDITYEEFQQKVDELAYIFTINTGQNPQGPQMDQIRNQAWQSFFVENVFQPEFISLGLEVSDAEMVDIVQGQNTHPHVIQMMGNPQTGQFDKSYVGAFLQQLREAPAQQQEAWVRFENTLPLATRLMRLDLLMDKTNYITSAEGKTQHIAQNSNATIEYVYVPFSSVVDSTGVVQESELNSYLKENEKEFDREEARDIAYVTFDIKPSAADSAIVWEEIQELATGLQNAQNDSTFAVLNSDGDFAFMTYNKSSIPEFLLNEEGVIPAGTVTEPSVVQDRVAIYKMSRVQEANEFVVKASHILVTWEDESDATKSAARSKANDVLRRARRGEDFTSLAAEFSEDPANAQRGGDLGWFGESSSFVQPFKDAAFGHSGTGVVPRVVETQFGYHIIKIDEPKDNTEYKVAIIEKEFFVSNETLDEAYREAGLFQAGIENSSDFETKAEAAGLEVQRQNRVTPQAERIGGLREARGLVMWLFNEANVNDVSEVFELNDQYVVATMTGIQEKGIARLSDVENQVTLKVRNEKKSEMITQKLSELSGQTFEEMVSNYGDGATTGEATLTLSSNSITGVGLAPEAVGVAFAMEEGDLTQPIETSNGVLVMKLAAKNMAEDTDDYSVYVQQLFNQRNSRKVVITDFPLTYFRVMIGQHLEQAMKELSGMEDKRYKFF